jgi:hypothetical protein
MAVVANYGFLQYDILVSSLELRVLIVLC